MLDRVRGVLRISTRDVAVGAAVAAVSFAAGLVWSATSRAQEATDPKLKGAKCVSECEGEAATIGSKVKLTGKGLEAVETVKFTSDGERRAKAKPVSVADDVVKAVVPEGAVTGPPRVVDAERNKATAPDDLEIAGAGEGATSDDGDPNDPTVPGSDPGTGDAPGDTSPDGLSVDPVKGFFKGKRQATAHVSGGSVSELEVVSAADGTPVATVPVDSTTGEGIARWDGITDTGEVAQNGEYEFRAGSGGDSAAFEQYDHIFPVKGKHTYGDGLGAGRNHQGQDVFADCGRKMVAARAGKVEHVDSHEAAGNYLVIDGKKTDTDYVYMHLQDAALVAEGERVKTGQAIGHVGESGNASGCHLHFEMWDAGWQEGDPADPEPELKAWDEWS